MLLDFQVENYRSYHRARRFSLVASRQEELPGNVAEVKGFDLGVLRSAVLYGANASGKSNLFQAIWFLGDLVRQGPDAWRAYGRPGVEAFALDPAAARRPTRFEINFLAAEHANGPPTRFEYHLGLLEGRVVEEWLNAYPSGGKRQRWFVREDAPSVPARLTFSKTLPGAHKSLKKVTPPEMPFLGVAATFGHQRLSVPADWVRRNCYNLLFHSPGMTASRCHEDPAFVAWASDFLRHADLGIRGVRVDRRELSQEEIDNVIPPYFRNTFRQLHQNDVAFMHESSAGEAVPLPAVVESHGTKKLFDLLAPLSLALREGRLLLVDEMSSNMHPLLTQRLIEAFHDPAANPRGAQLLLTTHDATLLRGDLFRRDQVWFTEKKVGETDLYSLHSFQPRPDVSLEKNYLAGRYGAIPLIGRLDFGNDHGSPQASEQETPKGRSRPRPREAHGSPPAAPTGS